MSHTHYILKGIEPFDSNRRRNKISIDEFKSIVRSSGFMIFMYEYEIINNIHFYADGSPIISKNDHQAFYCLNSGKTKLAEISHIEPEGKILVYSYERKENIDFIEELNTISKKLNARFLYDVWGKEIEMDDEYMNYLREKHGKSSLAQDAILSHTFGENSRWIAIRSKSVRKVTDFLGLKKPKETNWDDAFTNIEEDNIIITPPIEGWIFLIGTYLENLLPKRPLSGVTHSVLFENLKILSKQFGEVHWYEDVEKYGVNCYVRSIDGEIMYGYLSGDDDIIEVGIKPYELTKEAEYQAIDVAGIWSIHPEKLRYMESLRDKKVKVFVL